MKYKIIKAFGCFINLQIGEVREFTDADAIRLSHFLEKVGSESVNSTDIKPNKMHTKGERKMKKIIALLLVFGLIAMGEIPLIAAERELTPYSVDLSTYPVTDPIQIGIQLALTARIHHILITNSDATVAQTVSFYENATDTTTVTAAFSLDIASTSASGYVEPIQIPFPIPASPLALTNLCIRKSSLASSIKVTLFYR